MDRIRANVKEAPAACGASRAPVKSVDQQTIATLHRLRGGWMTTRRARLNALRGALRELGFVAPMGASRVLPAVHEAMLNGALPTPLVHAGRRLPSVNATPSVL